MARLHSRRDLLRAGGLVAGGLLGGAALTTVANAAQSDAQSDAQTDEPWTSSPGSKTFAAAASPWDDLPNILARIKPPTFPNKVFNITDYGAKSGSSDSSDAFKKAIVAANAAGGGQVLVPEGSFLTGAVTLLSNVNLHLADGATVKFSTDPKKYPNVFTRWQGIELMNFSAFIYAYGATNVAITGEGSALLDGQGPSGPWFDYDGKRDPDWQKLQQQAVDKVAPEKRVYGMGHFLKPNFIQLYKCQNVLIDGVHLRNSAMWNIHPVLSSNITVRNVNIYSRGGMVDGIDPESCRDVYIHDNYFDTGDDSIAIKSGRDADGLRINVPTENVVVEKNQMRGRWGALTVGSEASGGARNIFFQDCDIAPGSSYHPFYAVYIKTNKRRGGIIENINVRNITGKTFDKGVIYVTMNYSLTGPGKGAIVNPVVRNITIENLTANGAPAAIQLDGLSASHIKNVKVVNSTFTNVKTAKPSIKNADGTVFTNVKINGKTI
jgi:polygalacturonase